MITIDQLRRFEGAHARYMGTGVVKLHVTPSLVYRFYSMKAAKYADEIHDHRSGFTSRVLKGELKNYIYDVDGQNPNSTLQIVRSECKANADKVIELTNAVLSERCTFTTTVGQSYHLAYNTLHRIECLTPKVITAIQKEPNIQSAARIVMDTAKIDYECPLGRPKSEKECWELIEYTLNDDD